MFRSIKNVFKGWIGEKKTTFNLWVGLSSNSYHKFHDIIIPSKNGTTQIDHLIVSVYGLFIVETKNKTGWIYGSEDQKNWTQTIYGNKYSFQNPLKQTYRQKKVLASFLNLHHSNIETLVYFVGDCKFKTYLPDNVIQSGASSYIRRFQKQIFSEEKARSIINTLENHLSESKLTSRDHIKSLNKRHSSTTTCPRCGGNLLERVAKHGSRAGKLFLGCSNFPKCRFSKNL